MDFLCYLYTKVIITLKDAYMMKQGSMRGRFPDRFHSPNLFYLVFAENDTVIITNIQFLVIVKQICFRYFTIQDFLIPVFIDKVR